MYLDYCEFLACLFNLFLSVCYKNKKVLETHKVDKDPILITKAVETTVLMVFMSLMLFAHSLF